MGPYANRAWTRKACLRVHAPLYPAPPHLRPSSVEPPHSLIQSLYGNLSGVLLYSPETARLRASLDGKMEAEGQWWKSQLASDIHQALRIKELKLPTYHAHSPQIGMRRYFADLLAVLSNRYQLCPTARHLAVYLLDLFMDHYDVAVRQLYVIALSCLLLASKFEEKEDRCRSWSS
ncbi:hypothetical protein HF521_005612 [Silurus meridionalis]|uniref:Cyclin N-terminal domain-containing protein n=1 Tax=Silurus meridionalis TaxID=175797 RepID=A0A8T0AV73_SILME|nr:hypothetical protein HF521_005612 [Silurus meridionalis]